MKEKTNEILMACAIVGVSIVCLWMAAILGS